jgi:hypothetical protein
MRIDLLPTEGLGCERLYVIAVSGQNPGDGDDGV